MRMYHLVCFIVCFIVCVIGFDVITFGANLSSLNTMGTCDMFCALLLLLLLL